MNTSELAAFVWIAGFVIGLGAVTVIETIGFLGQRSGYWTEATIRTHKVTKPLIWLGLFIATFGGTWYYSMIGSTLMWIAHGIISLIMIVNGSFLTFWVSPRLLERERRGKATELLPKSWKTAITLSFCISIVTWWSALAMAIVLVVE
ncbi:MAG: hypothetical protein AAB776_03530 [Patescibacteria group bacterium]